MLPSPHSTHSETVDEKEPRDQRPSRERRAPKMFTYDRLVTPVCYSRAQADQMFTQYQSRLYTEVQPMTIWANLFQFYQPVLMQGYQN